MKRLTSLGLALLLTLAVGAGLAETPQDVPKMEINPQQRGHVAYLESLYGKSRAEKIIEEYKHTPFFVSNAPDREHLKPNNITEGTGIYIPQPSTSTPNWDNLRVGDYFTYNGQYYYVGRFTTISNARVLVAYPSTQYGVFDASSPRYFYV